MMSFILLEPSEYHRVLPLITDAESVFLPPTLAILEQVQPGSVYVDIPTSPSAAVVLRQNESHLSLRPLGRSDNAAFNAGLIDYLNTASECTEDTTTKHTNISTSDASWEDVIYQALGYRVSRIKRTQFEFEVEKFQEAADAVRQLKDGDLTFRRIDAPLIASNDMLTRYTEALWQSPQNYLQHAIGWVAMQEYQIKASCDSVFVGGKLAELNIGVSKALRGRGIGLTIAIHFIRDCIAAGLTPNWTCDTDNVASFKMAEKLGFRATRGYYMYSSDNTAKFHEPARA